MAIEQPPIWPIFNNVIFDCDSTLTTVEGIDELARITGQDRDIALLTKRAMEGDIPLEAVYGHRLTLANPTQEEVLKITQIYRETAIPDAKEVIRGLKKFGTQVFIVSGGLIEPVQDFGVWLGVPRDHIYAVGMAYDQLAGKWWRYWEHPGGNNPGAKYLAHEANPLTGTGGKNRVITARIRASFPGRTMLVGDGGSDLEASSEVDLFVGFGGVIHRSRVAEASNVYIKTPSLSPIFTLALGQLGNIPGFVNLWADGLQRVYSREVVFKEKEMMENFLGSLKRSFFERE